MRIQKISRRKFLGTMSMTMAGSALSTNHLLGSSQSESKTKAK